MSEIAIVRVKSHRAMDKLVRLLGYSPVYYWSMLSDHVYEVPKDLLPEILKIKGITKSKVKADHHRSEHYMFSDDRTKLGPKV